MVSGSFKDNSEIFRSLNLIVPNLDFTAYREGWELNSQLNFGNFIINSLVMVIPWVLFTIVSSLLVGFGFARFVFPLKNILFVLMLATIMIPPIVIIVPRYILFHKIGWLDTYLVFQVPALFGAHGFFILLMYNFIRGIPKEMDESAIVDGCNYFQILARIILPNSGSALFSVGILQFIWTWNDFFNPLIFINSVKKYPVSLGLKMTIDAHSKVAYDQILAMSFISIIPPIIIFFLAQKHFVEGISTTGLKD
jgi:oligogalacturonide transport system permease protein